MLSSMDLIEKARRYEDYLQALEDERRKIHVFQRELPLCLQLVSQTIENVRNQIESMVSEETVSDGPVLEEFIPLKPSLSSTSDEESAHEVKKSERSEIKNDWMQSAQLWNQAPDPSPPPMEPPYKPIAVNARKIGGAFQPFEKEKHAPLPASSTGATSSTAGASSGEKKKEKEKDRESNEKEKEEQSQSQSQSQRKSRRCWSPELHRRFLHALQQLGGSHAATPKQIRELMKVDGLTNDEVKSHLQKYRLHTRRPNSAQSGVNNNSQPGQQFVVVGGIWVPQSDYATAVATAAAAQPSGETNTRSPRVYTPVASVPSPQKQNSNRPSVDRPAGNADAGNKSAFQSPSTSSSSQTTTASPPF